MSEKPTRKQLENLRIHIVTRGRPNYARIEELFMKHGRRTRAEQAEFWRLIEQEYPRDAYC